MKKTILEEKKQINTFRSLFPDKIVVKVHRSECGKFCSEIVTFPGCLTESDTFSGLIEMINDAVKTYFEIPEKYHSFMPEYLAPIDMAQAFNAFPVTRKIEELNLINTNAGVNG
jgi:predicted RNase H-like HicB family nuclease